MDVQKEFKDSGPPMMNAFELITLSQGLNLSVLFDKRQVRELKRNVLLVFVTADHLVSTAKLRILSHCTVLIVNATIFCIFQIYALEVLFIKMWREREL